MVVQEIWLCCFWQAYLGSFPPSPPLSPVHHQWMDATTKLGVARGSCSNVLGKSPPSVLPHLRRRAKASVLRAPLRNSTEVGVLFVTDITVNGVNGDDDCQPSPCKRVLPPLHKDINGIYQHQSGCLSPLAIAPLLHPPHAAPFSS